MDCRLGTKHSRSNSKNKQKLEGKWTTKKTRDEGSFWFRFSRLLICICIKIAVSWRCAILVLFFEGWCWPDRFNSTKVLCLCVCLCRCLFWDSCLKFFWQWWFMIWPRYLGDGVDVSGKIGSSTWECSFLSIQFDFCVLRLHPLFDRALVRMNGLGLGQWLCFLRGERHLSVCWKRAFYWFWWFCAFVPFFFAAGLSLVSEVSKCVNGGMCSDSCSVRSGSFPRSQLRFGL